MKRGGGFSSTRRNPSKATARTEYPADQAGAWTGLRGHDFSGETTIVSTSASGIAPTAADQHRGTASSLAKIEVRLSESADSSGICVAPPSTARGHGRVPRTRCAPSRRAKVAWGASVHSIRHAVPPMALMCLLSTIPPSAAAFILGCFRSSTCDDPQPR